MRACVISETSALAADLGFALSQVKIRFVVRNFADVTDFEGFLAAETPQLVFLAISQLRPLHLEALRRLRKARQVKIVIFSAIDDPGAMLEAIRAGADDFLSPLSHVQLELEAMVSRLPVSERREGKGQLIAIWPTADAGDANFVAANLAVALAQRSSGCTLLDLHWRGGDLALHFSLSPRHTLSDLLSQGSSLDYEMLEQALAPHESGVRLMASPPLFSLREVDPELIRHLMDLALGGESTVLANMPDATTAYETGALAISRAVIVTTRLELASLARTKQHLRFLDECGVSRDRVNLVAVGTGRKAEVPLHEVRRIAPSQQIHGVPDDPLSHMVSLNMGEPMVSHDPKGEASRAIFQMADKLTDSGTSVKADERTSIFSFYKRKSIATAATL